MRPSFTARRRAQLARRVAALEAMEPRSMITESLGMLMLAPALRPAWSLLGSRRAEAVAPAGQPLRRRDVIPMERDFWPAQLRLSATPEPAARTDDPASATQVPAPDRALPADDWLPLLRRPASPRHDHPVLKAALPEGSGGAGGTTSGGGAPITPFRVPPPTAAEAPSAMSAPGGTSTAPTFSAGVANPVGATAAPQLSAQPTFDTTQTSAAMTASPTMTGAAATTAVLPGVFASGGRVVPPPANWARQLSQPSLLAGTDPVYTLDYNDGTVLFPGAVQLGTPGGSMDLRAQVSGATVSSYSWDTSGLTRANSITGTSTYRLQFQWGSAPATPTTNSVTLTVYEVGGQTVTQTYSFLIPSSTVAPSGGAPSWPTALAPDQVLPAAPAFAGHNLAVAANTGALETTIGLPAYNPNVAPLVLAYDSLDADPRPIVVVHHELDPAQSTPTEVSAALTFNGSAGTTYYYDTSAFNPGVFTQLALQADATGLATGRYGYSVALGDIRGSTTTSTVTGTTTVLNDAGSTFGAGWTLAGLERIDAASGGVILELGGGASLWFTGSFGSGGGTFTSPAGDFSTLALNANGTYTRTLTDGTTIQFNSSGVETASADRNGNTTSFAYTSGRLTTITDPYSGVTTFAYDGSNRLQTVTDPAGRVTTFAHTGSNLTGVTLPDASGWSYGYDAAGRMTSLSDPNGKAVTIAYDAAERVATLTQPDSTTETVTAFQERGWTNSGTSGSPAPALQLAEARASFTDPLSHTTDLRPDWRGQGLTNQTTDPAGNVTTADRDANGLATISIDPINRVTQYAYDASGNMATVMYPSLSTEHFTYNGFAEPTTHTDPNGNTTTFTYDNHGNRTGVEDPLHNRTTMTYTGTGRLATAQDARGNTTSYAYDGQDRLTTTTYPDSSTRLTAYDSAGNPTTLTDERGNVTVQRFDALNRRTGVTDALSNVTTYAYDSAGNLTAVQAPLSRTTSYAYDAMDRQTTVTDPLGHATVIGYDAAGNPTTVTDSLSRVTTTSYDALNRPTVVTDPLGHQTTSTYDAAGQQTGLADPLGHLTSYTYNAQGWQETKTDPNGGTTSYTYDAAGHLLSVSDASTSGGSYLAQYTYDLDSRQITSTDAYGKTTTTVYDAVGNVIAKTDPNNHTTSYAYDARNRLTTVTDALGHATVTGYDAAGNPTTITDPLGHTTTTAYDALNRATTLTDPRSGQTLLLYDAAGRQSAVVDAVGNRTTYAYDAADRLTTQTDPNGATTTYAYDSANELIDRTDRDGRRVTFAYDNAGRQVGESWLNGSGGSLRAITYTYDNAGHLTGAADPDATLTFTYDGDGNQTSAATSGGAGQPAVTLTSTFNATHDRTSVADDLASSNRITFIYDLDHRVVSITQAINSLVVDYGYDAASRVTSLSRPNGTSFMGQLGYISTSFAYDVADRLTTLTHQNTSFASGGGSGGGGWTTTPLATYLYAYDNANRLATETNAEGTVTYAYDAADELTGVAGARSESYGYDLNGNRNTTGYATQAGNELTAAPGTTYTYDAEGNLTGKTDTGTGATTTYAYDYHNRLTGVTVRAAGGAVTGQATYTYDALNRRIGADDNGTQAWTVYDDQNPYADFGAGGSGGTVLLRRYLYGPAVDALLARTDSGGTTAWYLTDRLGTVRDIANASGSVIDHTAYDSYGKVTSETSPSNGDRFKFTGREYDSVVGLYDYRARDYDPASGRFINRDSKGFAAGDYNLYRYVGNGPINGTDPTGNDSYPYPAGTELIPGVNASTVTNPSSDQSYYYGDFLDNAANFAAGWGDSLSMGLTDRIRNQIEIGGVSLNSGINHDSGYYVGGQVVGSMQNTALSFVNPCAAGSMSSGVRLINAVQATGGILNAGQNASEGNYGAAALDLWGVLGNVAQFSKSCFVAGTPILTPKGSMPIEQFRPGDWVLARDEDNPESPVEPRIVEEVFRRFSQLVDLMVAGRLIRTTGEHPFYVVGRGWTPAVELTPGDRLSTREGRWVEVERASLTDQSAAVYNMRVAEYHTYFVGSNEWGFDVWAHNADLYKAPQPGKGENLMSSGFSATEYPGGASLTPNYELAEEYAECYREGIVKITIPDETYSQVYKGLEQPYISNPSKVEVRVPPQLYDDLNNHSRTLITGPWIGPYGSHS